MNVGDCIPETAVTYEELMRLGEVVLNAIATMSAMGHVSPTQVTLYADPGNDLMTKLLHDMLLTCVPGGDSGARERICRFVDESGWVDRIADAVTR